MYRNSSVAVVVPAYNEASFIADVLRDVPEYVDRIYAVDDCSTDDTRREIERTAADLNARTGGSFDRVVALAHEENRGVGGAIKTGYERARDDDVDVTAVMAGDGQMDPDELERFLDPIIDGRADYTKGNRLWRRDHWESMSGWRQFGNRLLTLLTRIASGYWEMSDPQNGYTAISKHALETVPLEDLYEDYGFANDLLVHLNVNDLRIADVPHEAVYGDEESDIAYASFVPQLSVLLLRDFCWRLKTNYLVLNFHPTVLCYVLGVVGTVSSAARALATFRPGRESVTRSGAHSERFLSFAVFLLGSLFLVLALVFDMEQNENLVVRTDGSVRSDDRSEDQHTSEDTHERAPERGRENATERVDDDPFLGREHGPTDASGRHGGGR
ncbi:glycosyltransferase family 2 protein [Salinigranum halophilum]|uniref:glycosyltransferase family 2 protein n=1 Tax=Salinigranum halophilum TaxID=2565931 RepID=UPI0010A93E18|nr:glycosyltransferase family 2 protein [Salinigranum halophilum]